MSFTSKTPFPWFGGKTDASEAVWAAIGDVDHYAEPFAGGLAVLLNRPHECNRTYFSETINDIDGLLCLAPETLVLSDDLRWRRIGDLLPGDRLVAFDENNGPPQKPGLGAPSRYRRMAIGTVISTNRVVKQCYRLSFSDGTTVIASGDHQWLCGSHRADAGGRTWRWTTTKGMIANRHWQRSWVLKVCDVVEQEQTYDGGWLGGFLDGEGNLRWMESGKAGWSINCTQKIGPEATRYAKLMTDRGFVLGHHTPRMRSEVHQQQATVEVHGKRQVLRLLMMLRPERLINNLLSHITERSLYGREHSAVSLEHKELLGPMEVVALETDTHTYIAQGLASHNCNAWRGIQLYPDATAEAASWPVSEADLHARHLALVRWRRDHDIEKLMADPKWCDVEMAGWWLWGCCCWIGGGWCSGRGAWVVDEETGRIVRRSGKEGAINRRRPHLIGNGQGVNHAALRELGVAIEDYHPLCMPKLKTWFAWLSARLRHVRILNGDWTRAVTGGATLTLPCRMGGGGICGVFLDPPYADTADRDNNLYAHDSLDVAHAVREWAIKTGPDKRYRIVMAGFEGEHGDEFEKAGWRCVEWFKDGFLKGGMARVGTKKGKTHQQHRERLWCSPHCLVENDCPLFAGMDP